MFYNRSTYPRDLPPCPQDRVVFKPPPGSVLTLARPDFSRGWNCGTQRDPLTVSPLIELKLRGKTSGLGVTILRD